MNSPFILKRSLSSVAAVLFLATTGCSVASITSPIDPGNPAGVYFATTANGVGLPAQQTTKTDTQANSVTIVFQSSRLTLGTNGAAELAINFVNVQTSSSGVQNRQSLTSISSGTWRLSGGSLNFTFPDPLTQVATTFPGTSTAAGVTLRVDFAILNGVPLVFQTLYQPSVQQ